MANRYGNLVGSKRISEDYRTVNTGFDRVQADVDSLQSGASTERQERIAGDASLQTQVNTLVINGDSSAAAAQAAVDADGHDYGNLKLRLDTEHTQVTAQLADIEDNAFATLSRQQLFTRLREINAVGGRATFVGDSVTESGWFWPLQSLFPSINIVNKGIGGNGTVDVINRLADITSTNADLYVLAIGTNDVRYQDPSKGATTPTGYADNIETIYTALGIDKTFVITPWPAFDRDHISVLGFYQRDNLMDQYIVEARKKCDEAGVPFIEVTAELRSLLDFANKSAFLIDSIHPNNTTGRALYTAVTLFGNQQTEKWGVSRSKTSAKYVYKLEIWSALSGDQIDLRYIEVVTQGYSPVIGSWTTAMLSGSDNLSQVLNNSSGTYHFKNNPGDYPVIITFSANAPLQYINYAAHTKAGSIGAYKIYESEDPYALLDFESASWRLINTSDRNRKSVAKLLYAWGKNVPKSYIRFEVVATQSSGNARISQITGSRALDAYMLSSNSSDNLSSVLSGVFSDQYIELSVGDSLVFGSQTDAYKSPIIITSLNTGDLITRYRLYVTYDDMTNIDDTRPEWTLISDVSGNAVYNITATPNSQMRSAIPATITYGSGMTNRGQTYIRKVNGVINVSLSVKKSSAWAPSDVLATLPTAHRPTNVLIVSAMSHGDTTGACTLVPVLVNPDGTIQVWNRAVNANSDDSISLVTTFA